MLGTCLSLKKRNGLLLQCKLYHVFFLSTPIASAPVITKHPSDVVVYKNSPADLTCSVSGSPKPNIYWLQNGVKVPTDQDGRRFLMNDGTLHFLRVTRGRKRTDTGIYQCVASNRHGTVYSKNASLIVGSEWLFDYVTN